MICWDALTVKRQASVSGIQVQLAQVESTVGSMAEHKFCPVCGVAVGVDDTVENMKAVNLRCFEGVEWALLGGKALPGGLLLTFPFQR
jgi:hypothetical protein